MIRTGLVAVFVGWALLSTPAKEPELSIEARSFQPGEILLAVAKDAPLGATVSGTFLGEKLTFFRAESDSWASLAPIPLDAKPGTELIELVIEEKGESPKETKLTKEVKIIEKIFSERKLTVDPRFVKISAKNLKRAKKEEETLGKIFRGRTTERLFGGNFESPVPGSEASRFGERSTFNGEPRRPHGGADLAATEGTAVKVPEDGEVVFTGDLFFSGLTVILDHGLGLFSYYSHLSKIDVKKGEKVTKGHVLGNVGSTGRVTGPHLHWGVKILNRAVDPFSLVALDLKKWLPKKKAASGEAGGAPQNTLNAVHITP